MSGPERIEIASHFTSVALHLILQLGYFKARQQFFAYDLQSVFEDLRYIHERYFPSRTCAFPGTLSRPTHLALQKKIFALCDYRVCDNAARDKLEHKAERIALLSTQPLFILREILQYLTQQRLIAPPYRFLQKLVGKTTFCRNWSAKSSLRNAIASPDFWSRR